MKIHLTKKLLFAIPALVGLTEMQAQQQTPVKSGPGINMNYMDKSVRPQDNFFRYVNGTWLNNTTIPGDKTTWGSFHELRQNTDKDALAILKNAASNPKYKSNTDQGKAINLYLTVMDTVSRNKQGITPLKPYLDKINKVKNTKDLQTLLAEMEPIGSLGFYGIGIGADEKDSNKNVVYVGIGGLGLPDRDYYTSDEKDTKEIREKYVAHLTRMLQFLNESATDAQKDAKAILELETTMARAQFDRVERRDTRKQYNPMTIAELQKLVPSINWTNYLNAVQLNGTQNVIVMQPKYMAELQNILKKGDIKTWKAYMRWMLLKNSAGELSTNIETANWEFYGKTLTGALKQRPRNEKALQTVNGTVGEALGKLYVEQKFPAEAKAKAIDMIHNIIKAYENRISNLTWMSAQTKVAAYDKLNKLTIKVGYPDKWEDYSALTIKSPAEGGNYFENLINYSRWHFNKDLEDLKKPVDKTKWGMSPQTVNAYYNPSFNEIVFPAAILQPPFYDYKADEAVNYGGIGAVIGHEISHGFDDQGARYNADGNLIDWWTEQDAKQFAALTGALAQQYSSLEALPGVHVDGEFTLGENIGDLGGVNAAYDGLQLYLKSHGNPGLIDGYTPEQRFFISWATIWRTKSRDEHLKNQVKTDPHSPAQFRGYVPLQNVDAFYKAFDIKAGDGMYLAPEKRVKIW